MLHEQYRPTKWEDVIGQEAAIASLARIKARTGFGGRAYLITGGSGQGKTTIARIMASEVADKADIHEIDARDCTIDAVREMVACFRLAERCTLFSMSKVWIINETDDLRADVLARFKTALEPIPAGCAVIFTCTKESAKLLWEDSEDAPAQHGTCHTVSGMTHDTSATCIQTCARNAAPVSAVIRQ